MDWQQLLFSHQGRIRRTHYWLGSIGSGIAYGIVIGIIMVATGGFGMGKSGGGGVIGMIGLVICLAIYAAAFWTSFCLLAKRWHDRDKGAIWVLILLIPIIGALWTLVECGFLDGTQGPNKYGPSPKGIGGEAPAAA